MRRPAIVTKILDEGEGGEQGIIHVYCSAVYGEAESPRCLPSFESPHDFHLPRVGDAVWIDADNPMQPKWIGFYIADDMGGLLGDKHSAVTKPLKQRCVGFRDGSYIIFEEDSAEGFITIMYKGPKKTAPAQFNAKIKISDEKILLQAHSDTSSAQPVELTLDSKNKVSKLVVNKGDTNEQSIEADSTAGKMTLSVKGSDGTETIVLDKVEGIIITDAVKKVSLTDKAGNAILMDSNGVNVADSNGNTVTLKSTGITLEDGNGNKVDMGSAGVDINAGNLTVSS